MNKKILSLILIGIISSSSLIACGQKNSDSTNSNTSTTASDSAEDKPMQNSRVSENPTIDVNQVVSISDFKDKTPEQINSVLGDPVSSNDNVSTYKKDGYTFEITYYDSVCGQIKITPETEIKFPVDATVALKVVGITAGDSDEITPQGLVWNNKYDTYCIKATSNPNTGNTLGYIQIILDEKYK